MTAKFRGGKRTDNQLARGATTRWVMSRHCTKMLKISKLRCDIKELERQLKQHPLGAIILKATIKQKQIEMKNLNFKPVKSSGWRRSRGNY